MCVFFFFFDRIDWTANEIKMEIKWNENRPVSDWKHSGKRELAEHVFKGISLIIILTADKLNCSKSGHNILCININWYHKNCHNDLNHWPNAHFHCGFKLTNAWLSVASIQIGRIITKLTWPLSLHWACAGCFHAQIIFIHFTIGMAFHSLHFKHFAVYASAVDTWFILGMVVVARKKNCAKFRIICCFPFVTAVWSYFIYSRNRKKNCCILVVFHKSTFRI